MKALVYLLGMLLLACSSETSRGNDPFVLGDSPAIVIDADFTNEIDDEFAAGYAFLADNFTVDAIYAAPFAYSTEIIERGALSPLGLRRLELQLAEFGLTLENIPEQTAQQGQQKAYDGALAVADAFAYSPTSGIYRGSETFLSNTRTPVSSPAAQNLVEFAMGRDGKNRCPLHREL